MQYKLKYRHWFFRELICFFFGHKLRWSKTKQTKYYESNEEVPYGLHKSTGNALFEPIAWWESRCLRCRTKFRKNTTHIVWWRKQLSALYGAGRIFKHHISKSFFDDAQIFPWSLGIFVLPMAMNSAVIQYLIHFDDIPSTWITPFLDLESWWYGKLYPE